MEGGDKGTGGIARHAQIAIRRLRNQRNDYARQTAERIRRIERFINEQNRNDPNMLRLILNPLQGL